MKSKLLFISSLLFLIGFLSSCISNKKHIAAVDLLKAEADALLQQEVDLRDEKIENANQQITDLKLQLAERKGENNILVQLRDCLLYTSPSPRD